MLLDTILAYTLYRHNSGGGSLQYGHEVVTAYGPVHGIGQDKLEKRHRILMIVARYW